MKKYSYDPACEDLAKHFLDWNEDEAKELAQHIQDEIELWLQWRAAKYPRRGRKC